jgi:hypothetical protein
VLIGKIAAKGKEIVVSTAVAVIVLENYYCKDCCEGLY